MENDILGDNQNLEDGELWLPSDFFSADETNISTTKNTTNPSNIFGPFPQMQSAIYYGTTGGAVAVNGSNWLGRSPGSQFQRVNPIHSQVGNFMGSKTWSVPPNRLIPGGSGHAGTGVFLPKATTDAFLATKSRNRRVRKGQGKTPSRKVGLNERHEEASPSCVASQVQFPANMKR